MRKIKVMMIIPMIRESYLEELQEFLTPYQKHLWAKLCFVINAFEQWRKPIWLFKWLFIIIIIFVCSSGSTNFSYNNYNNNGDNYYT